MRTPAAIFYRRLWKQAEAARRESDRALVDLIKLTSIVADEALERDPSPVVRAAVRHLRHDMEKAKRRDSGAVRG